MSRNATPATEFARGCHCAQPCQCDLQKTRNTTRLKYCACHAKLNRTRPKCCACHEKCHACCENVAKVLRLPRKTIVSELSLKRSLASDCVRWKAAPSEHTSTPRPPKCKTRTLRYAFGKKVKLDCDMFQLHIHCIPALVHPG